MKTIWILGDQLHEEHPGLAASDRAQDIVLMIESRHRSQRIKYHQVKLALVYAAMRHRAEELRAAGWQVDYHMLTGGFEEGLKAHLQKHRPHEMLMEEPADFCTRDVLPQFARNLGFNLKLLPNKQFLIDRKDFAQWAGENKHLLMENHYRKERKRLKILVDKKGKPEGGEWNLDGKNRQTYSAFRKWAGRGGSTPVPSVPSEAPSEITRQVIEMVRAEFPDHPGDASAMWLPVTRVGARRWLADFVQERLSGFGPWEDVMVEDAPVLFHSVLSPLLNLGLLTPQECLNAALESYQNGDSPLNSVEGFVRQIIGWREFINGVYWHRGPEYVELNELEAHRPLPGWIHSGETDLNCLHQVLKQAIQLGYNHHIQRLMILGNFFLLGGFNPQAVLRWYLEMYVDAYDWVMAANVIGMVLYADGGYMSTKPYAAGSGYINKMSNYCSACKYDPEIKTGPKACPFNYLYWNFYGKHEERFAVNPRVSAMVKAWRIKSELEKREIRESAKEFLDKLG
jgi:deoxyribodipyrimidine photolyase-related protein